MQPDVEQIPDQSLARPADVLRALGLGIGFDIAFNNQHLGLGVALFAVAAAAALRPRIRLTWDEDLLLAGAVVLASFTAIRAAEWLVALNLMVATALVVGAVAPSARRLFRTTVVDLLRRAGHVVAVSVRAPVALLLPLGRAVGSIGSRRVRSVVRMVAIVAPVLIVFTALLASADRIFGDLIVPDLPAIDLGDWPVHAVWFSIGALLTMTALLAATRPMGPDPEIRGVPRLLRPAEWGTLLASIDVLFAVFVFVQIRFLFGGETHVEVTPGLTYAEYARSGFFQLLAVVVLTGLLILGLWDLGDIERHRTRFHTGVSILVALTGVVLASAVMRMFLYERAFGFTVPRLVVTIMLFTIGAALLCLLAAIWTDRRAKVIALLCCCAVAGLLALNIVNPERFVAEQNVRRFEQTGKVDVWYLTVLGHDAAAPTRPLLPALRGGERGLVHDHLCGLADTGDDWRSLNLARERARDVNLSCR